MMDVINALIYGVGLLTTISLAILAAIFIMQDRY